MQAQVHRIGKSNGFGRKNIASVIIRYRKCRVVVSSKFECNSSFPAYAARLIDFAFDLGDPWQHGSCKAERHHACRLVGKVQIYGVRAMNLQLLIMTRFYPLFTFICDCMLLCKYCTQYTQLIYTYFFCTIFSQSLDVWV